MGKNGRKRKKHVSLFGCRDGSYFFLTLIPAERSPHHCILPVINWSRALGKIVAVASIATSQIIITF